ncbi:PREDICTED: ankyrin repeat domain-containing protein 53 [Elephantulus edwardii]|uniref:ankyrin repeat domain-containing protein 53 n=1 Tax=Elephantulus edwardii TaxID=28737 RepID=UPI0003F0A674|nr:PREDICTED: ankyrin repeat domain-containing protein 53 [Elephantulus edwardii]
MAGGEEAAGQGFRCGCGCRWTTGSHWTGGSRWGKANELQVCGRTVESSSRHTEFHVPPKVPQHHRSSVLGCGEGVGRASSWPASLMSEKPRKRDSLKVIWGDTGSRVPENYFELFAAAVGNVDWLRLCLDQNMGDISEDSKGFTAVHYAAQQGKLACLKVLVEEYKFSVNRPTNKGHTPLHLAIHKDNRAMVLPCIHYLIKKKAAVNAQAQDGCTPLHVAAREGLMSCLKVLVENGANVHAQDIKGCKPVDLCKIWNHRACARFLKDAMWRQDKEDQACEMRCLKRLKGRLVLLEQRYLAQCQKECRALNEAHFKKWLHSKQLLAHTTQEPVTAPMAPTLTKTPESLGLQPSKRDLPFLRSCLRHKPTLQPRVNQPPRTRLAKLWDHSTTLARAPATQTGYPRGIRPRVQLDPTEEHDLSHFVKVYSDGHGGARLYTVTGQEVWPVPLLPLEVVAHALHPSRQPCRMKVPEGFKPRVLSGVPQKRPDTGTFWTDTLAMTLRETFDNAFLTAVCTHRGLPGLPAPRSSS